MASLMKCICQTGLLFFGCSSLVAEDYPSWWQEMGLILPEHEPDNYGVVNQGQLKNFGLRASYYMRFMLDMDDTAWGAGWSAAYGGTAPSFADTGNNFAAMNQGQGKHVVNGFYLLMEAHPDKLPGEFSDASAAIAAMLDIHHPDIWTYDRPWTGQDKEHYAPLLIGQLKFMFSFDLGEIGPWMDLDGDGIDDRLEWKVFDGLGALDDGNISSDDNRNLLPKIVEELSSHPEIQGEFGNDLTNEITIVVPSRGLYAIARSDLTARRL